LGRRGKIRVNVLRLDDYATPRNEAARFVGFPLLGPWLYRAFLDKQVPRATWVPLARRLIDQLAGAILSLRRGPDEIANFRVVDTRGTLTPPDIEDMAPTTHRLNEIHPNHEGCSKIGRKMEQQKL
jgi:hypothetical protein